MCADPNPEMQKIAARENENMQLKGMVEGGKAVWMRTADGEVVQGRLQHFDNEHVTVTPLYDQTQPPSAEVIAGRQKIDRDQFLAWQKELGPVDIN